MLLAIPNINDETLFPLQVYCLAISYVQEPVTRPQGESMSQWYYCESGKGEVTIDQQRGVVYPGQGFFIPAGTPHSYHGIEEPWVLHIIGYEDAMDPSVMAALGYTQGGIYAFSDSRFFIHYAEQMRSIIESEDPLMKKTLSKLCYSFLLDVDEYSSHIISTNSLPEQENELIQRIYIYLEKNYQTDISLDMLADETGRTKEYLCYIFKREMHCTIISQLNKIRITHARLELMTLPDKKIADIAHDCGFSSTSYFGKKFKESCHVTPNQYRLHFYNGIVDIPQGMPEESAGTKNE